MRWLGYDEVAISDIDYDAEDIAARKKQPHVIELAKDFKGSGDEPIHAPAVRYAGMAKTPLLCGRDRLAAALINHRKKLWVHLAECDDVEAKKLELRENIYRRPVSNRAEMLANLVELEKQQLRAEEAASGNTVAASDQTIASRARKKVARAAGVKPAAVKRAEERTKAKATPAPAPPPARPAAPSLPPSFETFGVVVPESRVIAIAGAIETASVWHRLASEVEENVRAYIANVPPTVMNPVLLDGIKTAAAALCLAIANAKPVALCAECKGVRCFRCKSTGVVGRFGNEGVSIQKRISVVDGRGQPIELEDE